MTDAVCPRCGHANKFRLGRLPQTCVCMVCESQLDWRNIPGCGPDCRPLPDEDAAPQEGPLPRQAPPPPQAPPQEETAPGAAVEMPSPPGEELP